jgi:murein DD-endopeptidase MepM/ murein hydrolase activator NlpD
MPVPLTTLLTAAALTVGLGPPLPAALSGQRPAGAWAWPLAGTPVVVRPFQPPVTRFGPGHRGVDLAGTPGATVLAAGPGVVSFAGYVAGVGVVSISHAGGLRTTYEPVAPSVVAGTTVTLAEPIGRLLSGHGDCGPGRWCLHWGLLQRGVYRDPLTLVRRGPVRLLPLTTAAPAQAAVMLSSETSPLPGPQGTLASSGPQAASSRPPSLSKKPARALPTGWPVPTSAATGTVGALAWSWRWTRKRLMAADRGRHRSLAPFSSAWLSRAGRRAWP